MLRDRNILENYPYDTGQLNASIQMLQVNEKEWIVLIGNESGSINGTPSNVYASITNDAKTLGKYNKPNRNYHWVNKILKKWAEQNMLQFQIESDDDDE
jgi:hypothetical protein